MSAERPPVTSPANPAFPGLIELVPGHLRGKQDVLPGQPLHRFLDVLGDPLRTLRGAIEQLLDDHFVERASADVLPLLADLFGARLLGQDAGTNRAVVAKAVAWRRRRGTLEALQELLSSTSRWPVEIDEGFRSLLVTQDARDPKPGRGRLVPLWDPIVLGDPLSRRPPRGDSRRDTPRDPDAVAVAPGETLDDALRRIGRADAGRFAVSPRTVDLRGWARPEGVLARSSRLVVMELEGVRPGPIAQRADGRRVFALDPLGRSGPLLWRQPLEETALIPQLTARHEPELSTGLPVRRSPALLTPTALAADPDGVEASGAVELAIDGVAIIGRPALPVAPVPLPFVPAGPAPRLRFADPGRIPAGQTWTLELLASEGVALEPILTTVATPGTVPAPAVAATARLERKDATVAVRVTRQGGLAARRTPPGGGATTAVWTTFALTPLGPPRSAAVEVTLGGTPFIVRLEDSPGTGTLRLAALDATTVAGPWIPVALDGAVPPDGPGFGIAAVAAESQLLVIGPDGSGSLGAWRIALTGTTSAQATRLDDPGVGVRPPARFAPSLCIHDGRVYAYGGLRGDQTLGDLWSLPASGGPGPWQFHFVRHGQPRVEAELLSAFGGLVLLGGQSDRGRLARTVFHLDLTRTRLGWRALPSLPIAEPLTGPISEDRPGAVTARAVGAAGGIEALVWDDTTRPHRLSLGSATASWSAEPPESTAPSGPPAHGELVAMSNGDFVMVGTPPLPSSELIARLGADAHLVFLPALDLPPGLAVTFDVLADGSARRRRADGEVRDTYERGPFEAIDLAVADGPRVGVVGRLGRQTYRLRQRVLGAPHDPALLPDRDDIVGLDARSARVILPAGLPPGELTVSYLVGRGSALGAGCLPRLRQPLPFWAEPDLDVPIPPDLPPRTGERAPVDVSAWISPDRAGLAIGGAGAAAAEPIWADAAAALASVSRLQHPVLGILGSALLPATRLSAPGPGGFSLVANDFGSTPIIAADPFDAAAPALTVFGDLGGDPTLPRHAGIWLAGLWVAGRTDVVVARGQVDLRWCTLGAPGEVSLAVAGGQHQAALGRRSLHPVELELRLYGCQIGVVEVPPWVRLVASGCTFDADSRTAPAIRALGAEVRLRHCSVRGGVEAGELRASSCAFGGPVRVDRRDLGWIRHSLLRWEDAPPPLHHTLDHAVSFASLRPTDPNYLVLAENNGPGPLAVGEGGRTPGAHGDRSDRQRELIVRTATNLPIGLRAVEIDRVPLDLARMGRRTP